MRHAGSCWIRAGGQKYKSGIGNIAIQKINEKYAAPQDLVSDVSNDEGWWRPESEEWRIGLLVEYRPWEKVGTVLYERKIYRVRAENIQKAGKKDWGNSEDRRYDKTPKR